MRKNYWITVLIVALLPLGPLSGQDEGLRNYDYTYLSNIKSVKFHAEGLMLSYPIVELGGAARLMLSFDDLDGDVKDYTYTFVHCDADWQPSNLQEMEYLQGFVEERIQTFNFSFKTLWPYTHYELVLPNQDLQWLVSGNYLLKIYDTTYDKELAITRRFMIVDPRISINPNIVRASDVDHFRTHQEIRFAVDYNDFRIRNPMQEIRAVILQNGRWDNAITALAPRFIRPNNLVMFDYQGQVSFPGGKEFRYLDIRGLRLVTFNIASVERTDQDITIWMKKEQPRDNMPYTTFADINGNFILETAEQSRNDLSGEYCDVFFMLETKRIYEDRDIFLFGGFTEWLPKPEFKMAYNPAYNAYVGQALLKQGYYDYSFATLPVEARTKSQGIPQADMSVLEGDSFEAENEYTILIYYRPFGSRYDQIIGALTFTS